MCGEWQYDLCSDETWMFNKPGKSLVYPMKGYLPDWTATDATHSCMPGCESVLAVTASWLIIVCGFCLCGIRSWKPHVWWFLEKKKLLKLLQQCWVVRAGPIPWPGRSCDFTLLDIFWSSVTEHIYIYSTILHSPDGSAHWNWRSFETCCFLGLCAA